jgi:hypothetical protein
MTRHPTPLGHFVSSVKRQCFLTCPTPMPLAPEVASASTATANVFIPPMAVPMRMPHLLRSSSLRPAPSQGSPESSRACTRKRAHEGAARWCVSVQVARRVAGHV